MAVPALATGFLIAACIRDSNERGFPAALVHRGDEERGTILLKIDRRDKGYELWTQIRSADGEPDWLRIQPDRLLTSLDAHDYTIRAIARDRDLWVVEIEDPGGTNPFNRSVDHADFQASNA